MTANSQLISVKALQALMKRGFKPSVSDRRHQKSWLIALDGDTSKRLFGYRFLPIGANFLSSALFNPSLIDRN
jgi:hypothetical protein